MSKVSFKETVERNIEAKRLKEKERDELGSDPSVFLTNIKYIPLGIKGAAGRGEKSYTLHFSGNDHAANSDLSGYRYIVRHMDEAYSTVRSMVDDDFKVKIFKTYIEYSEWTDDDVIAIRISWEDKPTIGSVIKGILSHSGNIITALMLISIIATFMSEYLYIGTGVLPVVITIIGILTIIFANID